MIQALRRIDPFVFFISLAVGFFAIYIMAPAPQVVVKFPSPHNAGKIVYRDEANTCFVYKADAVECPVNKSLIKPQPVTLN